MWETNEIHSLSHASDGCHKLLQLKNALNQETSLQFSKVGKNACRHQYMFYLSELFRELASSFASREITPCSFAAKQLVLSRLAKQLLLVQNLCVSPTGVVSRVAKEHGVISRASRLFRDSRNKPQFVRARSPVSGPC